MMREGGRGLHFLQGVWWALPFSFSTAVALLTSLAPPSFKLMPAGARDTVVATKDRVVDAAAIPPRVSVGEGGVINGALRGVQPCNSGPARLV